MVLILPNAWRVIAFPQQSRQSQMATVVLLRADSQFGTQHREGMLRREIVSFGPIDHITGFYLIVGADTGCGFPGAQAINPIPDGWQ